MKIIYFDGMSGSGKGTQIRLLKLSMQAASIDFRTFREPTELFRPFIKEYRRRDDTSLLAQAHLFAADRAHFYETEIAHLENVDCIVGLDRSKISTAVYQRCEQMPLERILELNSFFPDPNLALIFTLPPETAYQRILDRYERDGTPISKTENLEDLTRLKAGYEAVPSYISNSFVIDSSAAIGQMHNNILKTINKKLNLDLKPALSHIKAMGFDFDQTLYPKSKEVDEMIRHEVFIEISELEGISYEQAKELFYKHFVDSAREVLEILEHENAKEIVQKCLERADVASVLKYDEKVVKLLKRARDYFPFMFLITGANRALSKKKMEKIGIPKDLFDWECHADDPNSKKKSGKPFRQVMAKSGYAPHEHFYAGDREKTDVIPAKKEGFVTALIGNSSDQADFSLPTIYDLEGLF